MLFIRINSHMYCTCTQCMISFSGGEVGTALTCAANKGHVNILNLLLGQNVNVNGDSKVNILLLVLTIFTVYLSYIVAVITIVVGF